MEQRYSAFGRELLVVYLTVKCFHYFLKGCPFIIFTDHKPLTNAFTLSKATYSVRETCHLVFLAEFSTDLRHMKGADNIRANTLSRVSSLAMTQFMLQCLVELQEHNQELRILRSSPSSLLHFHDVYFPNLSISIICNINGLLDATILMLHCYYVVLLWPDSPSVTSRDSGITAPHGRMFRLAWHERGCAPCALLVDNAKCTGTVLRQWPDLLFQSLVSVSITLTYSNPSLLQRQSNI